MAHDGGAPIYLSGPDGDSDTTFEPGELRHLVRGSTGRLLDARRTPVAVVDIDESVGMFEVEVRAFEDARAHWCVPFEEAARFQFCRDGPRADGAQIAAYAAAIERLHHPLDIAADAAAMRSTRQRIAAERERCRRHLDAVGLPAQLDPRDSIARRRGDATVTQAVRSYLAHTGLDGLDDGFATQHVSNPWSGELIKGHAIVAAELGLAPYHGTAVRDERLFDGDWSRPRRAEHLIARLAISGEIWRRTGRRHVTLYRAGSSEADGPVPRQRSFVAATFSRHVAEAHFAGGPQTRAAWMYRQDVALDRIFMTFWETAAMNEPYAEAEALLLSTCRGILGW